MTAPTVNDYCTADDVLQHMTANLEIHYQTECENMSHEEAKTHFKLRESIARVREHLITQGEELEEAEG